MSKHLQYENRIRTDHGSYKADSMYVIYINLFIFDYFINQLLFFLPQARSITDPNRSNETQSHVGFFCKK